MLLQLTPDDRATYLLLEQRCQAILKQQRAAGENTELAAQAEGLSRLMSIYLRLLATRHAIMKVLAEAGGSRAGVDGRISQIQQQMKQTALTDELRRSLQGQLDILQRRAASQTEARNNLAFIESELSRIPNRWS